MENPETFEELQEYLLERGFDWDTVTEFIVDHIPTDVMEMIIKSTLKSYKELIASMK